MIEKQTNTVALATKNAAMLAKTAEAQNIFLIIQKCVFIFDTGQLLYYEFFVPVSTGNIPNDCLTVDKAALQSQFCCLFPWPTSRR